jgi:transposase
MSHKKRTTYTKEFKREAVGLILEQSYSIAEASRNLGINYNILSRWKTESQRNGEHAFPSKGHMTPEQAELSRLKAENKRLRNDAPAGHGLADGCLAEKA